MKSRRWMDAAFGWGMSAGFHLVLFLGAALVVIEQLVPVSYACPVLVTRCREPIVPIQEIERPRDVFERHSPVFEESTIIDPIVNEAEFLSMEPLAETRWRQQVYEWTLMPGNDAVRNLPITPRSSGTGGSYFQYVGSLRHGCPRVPTCNLRCTESAVTAALRWLARHQGPDGGWSAHGFGDGCAGAACASSGDAEFDDGVTGLAVLAFLGAGYSPLSKDELIDPALPGRPLRFGVVVKRGLQWLLSRQDPEGCVGPRGSKFMYGHAIATLALCEAYGITGSEVLREPAQKAVDFLAAARNPGAGWRYGVRGGDNDTSVTGWAVMALKSAELSSLSISPEAAQGALAWIDQATTRGPAPRVGYTQAGSGKVYIPGRNEQFADHPCMSAIGLASRILLRKDRKDAALALSLTDDLPAWTPGKVDYYYWYYGTLALFQFDGPQGPRWNAWNQSVKDALVVNQKLKKDGCANGSWNPAEDRWGSEGGRVYATALNALTLEIYYRYSNVFGGMTSR